MRRLLELLPLLEGDDADQLTVRLAALAGQLRLEQLNLFLDRDLPQRAKAALLLGLAQSQLRQGNLAEAQSTLEQVRQSGEAQALNQGITRLAEQIKAARETAPRAVGVILPLSGPYQKFGRRVLAAVQLGLGLFTPGGGKPPTLYIGDSKGQPAAAAAEVRRLVERHKVSAIIGPMTISSSLAASLEAERLKVPLINLSLAREITKGKPYVFQNAVLPAEQIQALLNELMDKQQVRRIAALAPRNNYGKGFVAELGRQLNLRGGKLVHALYYETKQVDFSSQIRTLLKLPPGRYRPGQPGSPRPKIDFQAVFVPDAPQRAGMVLSQLIYFDVTKVWLMGTSLWHSDSLLKLLRMPKRHLQYMVFPVIYDHRRPSPLVKRFSSEFSSATGVEPSALEARAFDAGHILRSIFDRPQPPRTREDLRTALAGLRQVQGVCGPLSVSSDRRVYWKLRLYKASEDGFVPLAPQEEKAAKPAAAEPRQPPAASVAR